MTKTMATCSTWTLRELVPTLSCVDWDGGRFNTIFVLLGLRYLCQMALVYISLYCSQPEKRVCGGWVFVPTEFSEAVLSSENIVVCNGINAVLLLHQQPT